MHDILQPSTNIHIPTRMGITLFAVMLAANIILRADISPIASYMGWAMTFVVGGLTATVKIMEIRDKRRAKRDMQKYNELQDKYDELYERYNKLK